MLYPDKYVVRVSVCKNRSGYNSPASYYARHEEGWWKWSGCACSFFPGPLWSSLVKWLVKGQGQSRLARLGQGGIKTCSYTGCEHLVASSTLEGNEGWMESTETTRNVTNEVSGLIDRRISVFTSDGERCYSPPEWAWAILHQSVWGWSCLLGTRHNPPAPENYKGACPCQGFRSGQKTRHRLGLHLFCIY